MSREAEDAAVAFLLQLDPATQREVLERYEETFQTELNTPPKRLRRIAEAFHEAKRTLGRAPSVREYKAMRREHPDRGWPDPRSVTRWLGVRSWNDALVRMRLEPVLDGDVSRGRSARLTASLKSFRPCATVHETSGARRHSRNTSAGSDVRTSEIDLDDGRRRHGRSTVCSGALDLPGSPLG
jgi:hypothetical protein